MAALEHFTADSFQYIFCLFHQLSNKTSCWVCCSPMVSQLGQQYTVLNCCPWWWWEMFPQV